MANVAQLEQASALKHVIAECAAAGCQMDRTAFEHLKTLSNGDLEVTVKNILERMKASPIPGGILTKQLLVELLAAREAAAPVPPVTAPLIVGDKLERQAKPSEDNLGKSESPIVATQPAPPSAPAQTTPPVPTFKPAEGPKVAPPPVTPVSPEAARKTLTIPVAPSVGTPKPSKNIESQIEIITTYDTEDKTSGGIEGFSHYFQDRFNRQLRLFRERPDLNDAGTIADALKAGNNEKVRFVAMIMEKKARGERLFIDVDDLDNKATVMVSDPEALSVAQAVPLDQVVCIVGNKARGDLIVAKELILPDIPDHRPTTAKEEVWAVLISDIHVGSNKFLPDALTRVLDWLNGRIGSPEQRHIAEHVKYVVVCGDIVDGIGIYPNQENELAISDLYEQYREAAKYFAMIPEHVEIIMLPGNHDAVRQALPQPPIPKEFAQPILDAHQVTSLSNPCEFKLHGVRMFEHHGRSLDDVIAGAPNLNYHKPEKAMKLQLQCRHVASEYGNRTSIAPWDTDRLVIENVPDVYQSGHIHIAKYENYRGTQIINSGTWQSQTDYQKRLNLEPTPGILITVNLQTLKIRPFNFLGQDEA